MGWSGMHLPYGKKIKDYMDESFGESNEVLDSAFKNFSQYYAAIKLLKGKHAGKVFCYTAMIQFQPSDRELWYKGVEESSGPTMSECPERILKLLSPVEELYNEHCLEWAGDWRKRCWSLIKEKKTKRVKAGNIIKLNHELSFQSGSKAQYFQKEPNKRNRWRQVVLLDDGRTFVSDNSLFCFNAFHHAFEIVAKTIEQFASNRAVEFSV